MIMTIMIIILCRRLVPRPSERLRKTAKLKGVASDDAADAANWSTSNVGRDINERRDCFDVV